MQNFAAIFAAAAAGFGCGAVYYAVLGRRWMAAAGLDAATAATVANQAIVISFLAELWIASILAGALILAPPEAGPWTMAIGTAAILWGGFVLPTMIVNHRFQAAPWALTVIDGAHWLGVLVIQAVVLQTIGLTPPA